jgi:hypothetical protein
MNGVMSDIEGHCCKESFNVGTAMKRLIQRFRGLLGVGITWGALWSVIGAGIGVVVGAVHPEVWQWTNPIFEWALGMGLYGLVSGIGFGTLLTLREGRKTLFDLSLLRTTVWGVLGAAAVPLLFGVLGMFEAGTTVADVLGAVAVTGFLGGTFAPVSVAMARRAELRAGKESGKMSAGAQSKPALPRF